MSSLPQHRLETVLPAMNDLQKIDDQACPEPRAVGRSLGSWRFGFLAELSRRYHCPVYLLTPCR